MSKNPRPINRIISYWKRNGFAGDDDSFMARGSTEGKARKPAPLDPNGLNPDAELPHGLTIQHVALAMNDYLDFLGFINKALGAKRIQRLESFLMPANFSSIVGEFMTATIPKHCKGLVKNSYHNGHPDLVPAGVYQKDSCLHGDQGIEVRASRHLSGWQGHNPEDEWLMVFVFESNSPRDIATENPPIPFRFLKVVGAELSKSDWQFSGRSATSRRTITASVKRSGFEKMEENWIYRAGPAGPS
jgi:hypothetical protein